MTKEINEENIRVAAYYIWEQAGRPAGKDKECWIKACEQLFKPKKAVKVSVKSEKKKVSPKAQTPVKKAEPAKEVKPIAKKAAAKPAPKKAEKTKAAPFYGSRK